MRLVDADGLMHTHKSEVATIGKDWTVGDLAAAIETAPTIDAIPVAWIETAISKFKAAGRMDAVEVVQSLIKAWKSEEELKGLLEVQLECMAKQIFAQMDEKGRSAIIEKLGYVPWSEDGQDGKNRKMGEDER